MKLELYDVDFETGNRVKRTHFKKQLNKILLFLEEKGSLNITQISKKLKKSEGYVSYMLLYLQQDNKVVKNQRPTYALKK